MIEVVLISLGLVFIVGALLALTIFAAVCPQKLWFLPPQQQPPPRKRARRNVDETIDLIEWRPGRWR